MSSHRSVLMLLAASTLAVLAAACGSADESVAGRSTPVEEASSPTATAAPNDAPQDTVVPDTAPSADSPVTLSPSTLPGDDDDSVDAPVITYGVQGMFPVTQPFVTNGPSVAVFADGTVLVSFSGDFAAQPQVWPYEVTAVDPSDVEDLLNDAADVGLMMGSDHLPLPIGSQIADPPRATITIRTATSTFVHTADALGIIDETDPARVALAAFTGQLSSLSMRVHVGDPFYAPTALDLVASPADPGRAGVAVPWPASAPALDPDAGCVVVTDPTAVGLLGGGLAGTAYRSGDVDYVVAARVHLPGSTC